MLSLVDKLAELKPSADLRNLPREQVLAQMKVIDSSKMALFFVPIIISAIVFLLLLPMLIHGLDNLNATIELNDLYLFLLIFSIVEVLIGGITIYLFKKSFS